jgi:integrase/recombinase XerC
MLTEKIKRFLAYCKTAGFRDKSLESLSIRLNEFKKFIQNVGVRKVTSIRYEHLSEFVADFCAPSIHVKKARVWALRQFFHYLMLNGVVSENPAKDLPYPKIERKAPQFLTISEYNRILRYCAKHAASLIGLRNLIIVIMLGVLGLRTGALVKLNIQDVDTSAGLLWATEKGDLKRTLVLPEVLCGVLDSYLERVGFRMGPLFLSKRGRRISVRTLQDVFKSIVVGAGVEKHLHAHLFRHTAGTHLNRIGGLNIAQYVLGHSKSRSTRTYTHLNPDNFAVYMKRHPFMKGGAK